MVQRPEAIVFDLLYTLVHPGTYPGGGDRNDWLAALLGLDVDDVEAAWRQFEPKLEAGQVSAADSHRPPEVVWIAEVAGRSGRALSEVELATIDAEWDRTRREALLHPPRETVATLTALRAGGIAIGVLSNTHALELRAWSAGPVAGLVDAVVLSHEIGAPKPDLASYQAMLDRLGTTAERCWYVGDGSSDELAGARRAGFAVVVLAERAARENAPERLPGLREQADLAVPSLTDLLSALPA